MLIPLLFTLLAIAYAGCDIDCGRIILQTTRKLNSTNNPLGILDSFHHGAQVSGFYDNTSAYELQFRANQRFYDDFGIDTNNSIPGQYTDTRYLLNGGIPYALNIPYGFGFDESIDIKLDTEEDKRGRKDPWFFLTFGQLISFIAPGNLTDSKGRVQVYQAGDLIVHHEAWMVKKNDTAGEWLEPENHELMIVTSEYIGEGITNSLGQPEQLIKVNTWTAADGVGRGILGITISVVNSTYKVQINAGTYMFGSC